MGVRGHLLANFSLGGARCRSAQSRFEVRQHLFRRRVDSSGPYHFCDTLCSCLIAGSVLGDESNALFAYCLEFRAGLSDLRVGERRFVWLDQIGRNGLLWFPKI